jgi:hypothetical protein
LRLTLTNVSLKRHRRILEQREIPYLRRFYYGEGDDYPYRSHGQPFTAFASLAGCLFILIVANGASLWIGFHLQTLFSAYLAVRSTFHPHTEISQLLTGHGADFSDDLANIFADLVGYHQMVQKITMGIG